MVLLFGPNGDCVIDHDRCPQNKISVVPADSGAPDYDMLVILGGPGTTN
jgi:hypothetical protein